VWFFHNREGKWRGGRNGVDPKPSLPPRVKTLTVEVRHSYSVLEHELVLLITQQRSQEFINRQRRAIALLSPSIEVHPPTILVLKRDNERHPIHSTHQVIKDSHSQETNFF
jgi:hypothetical protein